MEQDILFKAESITKKFGGLTAVKDMDLEIEKGKRHALIGPNGSGKTTMINVITGYYTPDSGNLMYKGEDISALEPFNRTKAGISRTFQNIRLFEDLSVRENIALGVHCNKQYNFLDTMFKNKRFIEGEKAIQDLTEEISARLQIADLLDMRISSIPYGQRKIIEIARALTTNPEIVFLDEPAAGMNNAEVIILDGILRDITKMDITILLVEHNMDFIKGIADCVTVMQEGQKIAEGCFDDISQDLKVIESYLGRGVKKHAKN